MKRFLIGREKKIYPTLRHEFLETHAVLWICKMDLILLLDIEIGCLR